MSLASSIIIWLNMYMYMYINKVYLTLILAYFVNTV